MLFLLFWSLIPRSSIFGSYHVHAIFTCLECLYLYQVFLDFFKEVTFLIWVSYFHLFWSPIHGSSIFGFFFACNICACYFHLFGIPIPGSSIFGYFLGRNIFGLSKIFSLILKSYNWIKYFWIFFSPQHFCSLF